MLLDLLIVTITILFVFSGINKGFVLETLNLIKFLVVIYLMPAAMNILVLFLKIDIENILNKLIVSVVSFIILYLILTLLFKLFSNLISYSPVSSVDKILGALFGLLKSSILVVIVIIIALFSSKYFKVVEENLQNSTLTRYISIYLKPYNSLFPKFIEDKLNEFSLENSEKEFKKNLLNEMEKGE